jgi:DNA-binding PadR family transcriptional regulator
VLDVYHGDIVMPTPVFLGEFEQLVLLSLLQATEQLGGEVPVQLLRERLEQLAGRSVSRGALYRTLDRLEEKSWVAWSVDEADIPERGGHPRRRFRVTPDGIAVLKAARETLLGLWSGLEEALS